MVVIYCVSANFYYSYIIILGKVKLLCDKNPLVCLALKSNVHAGVAAWLIASGNRAHMPPQKNKD